MITGHHQGRHPVPLAGVVRSPRRWSLLSVYALRVAPLDAIPDISDPQIIVYSKWPRSPLVIETEVTEPIIRALAGFSRHPGNPRYLAHGVLVRLRHSARSPAGARPSGSSWPTG